MGKLFKLVLFLVVMGFVGVIGFAYIGDLSPSQTDTRQPVVIDVD
ncbi:MAG: hypothetical protein V3U96_12450 [Paracoccaceae bacterium]